MLLDLLLSQCSKKQTFWLAESRQNSSHRRKANKSSHRRKFFCWVFFFTFLSFFFLSFFFFFLTLCVCICVFFWWSRVGVPLQGFLIWGFYSKQPEGLLQFLQIIHPVIIMQCTKKLGQLRAKRFCKILWDSHHCNCTKLALNLT